MRRIVLRNHQKEDVFWDTDLKVIEKSFLKSNQKITDLPTKTDDRVPAQGSVLLRRVVNLDS